MYGSRYLDNYRYILDMSDAERGRYGIAKLIAGDICCELAGGCKTECFRQSVEDDGYLVYPVHFREAISTKG